MLYILVLIVFLYTISHFLFKKNPIYLKVRKYIDIATIVVTSVLVFAWIEIFNLSFFIMIYLFLSLGAIIFLIARLRKIEIKKSKAEEVIKELKNEEKILENEIENLQK